MKGVILCGGYSRRMQTDKAFVSFKKKTFLERSIECVSSTIPDYYLSCRKEQLNIYKEYGSCIPDQDDGEGPLGGILSIMGYLNEVVLIMPCDMPLMHFELLQRLQNVHQIEWDATVYAHNNTILPFPLILNPHARLKLKSIYDAGERSLMKGITKLDLFRLPVDSLAAFINVNSPEQIKLLQA